MEFFKFIFNKIVYGSGVFFDLTKFVIALVIILAVVNTFFISVFIVDGISMEPNFKDTELVLWQKNSFDRETVQRGDVVVVNYPGDPKKRKYVKRIIGLPGERIDIYQGHIYINKKLLSESYIPVSITSEPNGSWQLATNRYFIAGDNRPFSNDSRYFGAVEEQFVLGKSLAVIWPRFRLARDM